jgi:hypothetical protein
VNGAGVFPSSERYSLADVAASERRSGSVTGAPRVVDLRISFSFASVRSWAYPRSMKRWYLFLIPVLLGLAIVGYLIVRGISPSTVAGLWNRGGHATNMQHDAGKTSEGSAVPLELLRLRREQQLRPLTEQEDGTKVENLPDGIYSFSMCNVEALRAKRGSTSALEIHKHEGIVFYVGYASDAHIEKYLTRQSNFHILTSPHPRKGSASLFEIPVEFVSKCEERPVEDGYLFDLFVTVIPELQT